jgi:hypothetical protein
MIPFRQFKIFLFFLLLIHADVDAQQNLYDTIFVQTDTLFNSLGIAWGNYVRTFEYNSEKPAEIMITFVFTTQKNQAITYRQETLYGELEWIDKEGLYKKEGIVEAVTAKLPAHNSVRWKYRYIIKNKPADKIITFDKSAVLMMDDQMNVKKTVWDERKFLLK